MKRPAILQWGTPPAESYKGILMRANPSLHAEALEILGRFAEPGSKIVDVGAGQGAFSLRLKDAGYHVLATDKNTEDFKAESVDFLRVDFDDPAQIQAFQRDHSEGYDVAVGMEVIEHVENPWEYCRFLLSLVRPGGLVLLTTPNAGSAHSRVEFMFSGRFAHFGEQDFLGSGHINPLTFHELALITKGIGSELREARTLCKLPWVMISRRPSVVLKTVLSALLRPFLGERASGDIICFLLTKPI